MLFSLENYHERVNVLNLGCDSATDVTAIATIVVKAMRLSGVNFNYTGGSRGWKGDVPQVRFDTSKMERLGWRPKFSSDEAVERAIKDILNR
jgi:UDP-glucose 4-epimerase